MADGVFNTAKGRVNELINDVAAQATSDCRIVVVLLSAVESDAALMDHFDLDGLLFASGNTEATFTAYARKELSDADIFGSSADTTANQHTSQIPDQTWTNAGGATNNTLAKLLVCYAQFEGAGDTNITPLTYHDFVVTTDGTDLTTEFDPGGFFRAE